MSASSHTQRSTEADGASIKAFLTKLWADVTSTSNQSDFAKWKKNFESSNTPRQDLGELTSVHLDKARCCTPDLDCKGNTSGRRELDGVRPGRMGRTGVRQTMRGLFASILILSKRCLLTVQTISITLSNIPTRKCLLICVRSRMASCQTYRQGPENLNRRCAMRECQSQRTPLYSE